MMSYGVESEKEELFGAGKEKVMLENEVHRLNAVLEEANTKILQQDKEIAQLREMSARRKKANAGMKRGLQGIYGGVLSLSKVMNALTKGDEPNMSALLGEYTKESKASDKDLSEEEVAELNEALESIRRSVCDYYAEKYSNECVIN